jgi:hypothetical protein
LIKKQAKVALKSQILKIDVNKILSVFKSGHFKTRQYIVSKLNGTQNKKKCSKHSSQARQIPLGCRGQLQNIDSTSNSIKNCKKFKNRRRFFNKIQSHCDTLILFSKELRESSPCTKLILMRKLRSVIGKKIIILIITA